jgi:hypothetical protein
MDVGTSERVPVIGASVIRTCSAGATTQRKVEEVEGCSLFTSGLMSGLVSKGLLSSTGRGKVEVREVPCDGARSNRSEPSCKLILPSDHLRTLEFVCRTYHQRNRDITHHNIIPLAYPLPPDRIPDPDHPGLRSDRIHPAIHNLLHLRRAIMIRIIRSTFDIHIRREFEMPYLAIRRLEMRPER